MNKIDAEKIALQLMQKHGLLDGAHPYRFSFTHAKTRFGRCSYTKRMIYLSAELTELNAREHVRNTILHEIAHALTPGEHHGIEWRKKAIEIGCNGKRCFDDSVIQPPPTYEAVCSFCGHICMAYRKRNCSCGKCDKVYNPEYKLHFIKI